VLRAPRSICIVDLMQREQTLIPVDMDQEEVALRFQKYALITAAVVDVSGRLVGMITVDDIVHIIQEEASEDALLLSGVGEGDINEPVIDSYKARVRWLIANLGTALVAATVIRIFEDAISQLVVLAALMPIVAGVGGNAGTQTLAVTVRALAMNQLTSSNRWRSVSREVRVAILNGLTVACVIGIGVALVFAAPCSAGHRRRDAGQHRHRGPGRRAGAADARTARRRPGRRLVRLRDHDHGFDGLLRLPRPSRGFGTGGVEAGGALRARRAAWS
jgi:magnesium transporter